MSYLIDCQKIWIFGKNRLALPVNDSPPLIHQLQQINGCEWHEDFWLFGGCYR